MSIIKVILLILESISIFIIGMLVIRNVIIRPVVNKLVSEKYKKAVQGISVIVIQVVLYYVVSKYIAGIKFVSNTGILDLLVGIVVGLVLMGLSVIILKSIKALKTVKNKTILKEVAISSVIFFALMALLEEIVFRGILYGILREHYSFAIVIVVTTIIFALPHLVNKGINFYSVASLLLIGLIIGVLREITGDIWLALGFHFSWNYIQAFLGINVSGDLEFSGVYKSTFKGPNLLSGGKFGIEASIVTIIILLITNVVIIMCMYI